MRRGRGRRTAERTRARAPGGCDRSVEAGASALARQVHVRPRRAGFTDPYEGRLVEFLHQFKVMVTSNAHRRAPAGGASCEARVALLQSGTCSSSARSRPRTMTPACTLNPPTSGALVRQPEPQLVRVVLPGLGRVPAHLSEFASEQRRLRARLHRRQHRRLIGPILGGPLIEQPAATKPAPLALLHAAGDDRDVERRGGAPSREAAAPPAASRAKTASSATTCRCTKLCNAAPGPLDEDGGASACCFCHRPSSSTKILPLRCQRIRPQRRARDAPRTARSAPTASLARRAARDRRARASARRRRRLPR